MCVCGLLAMTRELAFDLFFAAIWELESWPKITTGAQFVIVIVIVIAAAMGDRTRAPGPIRVSG